MTNLSVMFWLFIVKAIDIVSCGGVDYDLTECSEYEEIQCHERGLYCCGSSICCTELEHSTLRDHGYFRPKFVIMSILSTHCL